MFSPRTEARRRLFVDVDAFPFVPLEKRTVYRFWKRPLYTIFDAISRRALERGLSREQIASAVRGWRELGYSVLVQRWEATS